VKTARPGLLRILIVAGFVLASGIQAVRTAAVSAASTASDLGARIWPAHPRIMGQDLLLDVGEAAASGRTLDATALELLARLSRADPLAAEPFLVKAALEEKAGHYARSEQLLLEARKRDPRAPAARLLLAQAMLRRGDTLGALQEMAILARLVPGSFAPLTQALAAHAQSPSGVQDLKALIRKRPDLQQPLLAALAADPSNTDAILSLAPPAGVVTGASRTPAWQPRLLNGLLAQGRLDAAKRVWLRITGDPLSQSIYNPRFADVSAPQPFNWTLAQSGGAIAEPDQGQLHVVHFGSEDLVIAAQTLALAPGRYRLSLTVTGETGRAGQLAWRVRCLPKGPQILDLAIGEPKQARQLATNFAVPAATCAGQRLELVGTAQEISSDADVRLGNLQLTRLLP
jgi:tetratricopeptide (TPR) repeat protein